MRYDTDREAAGRLKGPAVALIIVAAIFLLLLLVSLAFDVWLLASGEVANLERNRGVDPTTTVAVRTGWGLLMLAANVVVIAGAAGMVRAKNRGLAVTACVLAVIPCLGPCFLLGIPFGIWGLVVLNDPDVRRAFADD